MRPGVIRTESHTDGGRKGLQQEYLAEMWTDDLMALLHLCLLEGMSTGPNFGIVHGCSQPLLKIVMAVVPWGRILQCSRQSLMGHSGGIWWHQNVKRSTDTRGSPAQFQRRTKTLLARSHSCYMFAKKFGCFLPMFWEFERVLIWKQWAGVFSKGNVKTGQHSGCGMVLVQNLSDLRRKCPKSHGWSCRYLWDGRWMQA